ncbi:MAG: hypothetical protein IPJ61_15060 [Tessaracoccus sp.]|uniref:hypothetical protein n=1 Tax=Tessaracoccus sp. TaxID=1971211 RepID=UPI001EBA55A1|nr:hypothetical protein [Tessaracoccus sp.]MBK7822334.1 hypothetical protein [Tessaracoccus sp.]
MKTLKASVKQGTISLAWKKASKATEYRVVQGKRGGTCPSKPPLNNGSQNWHVLKSNKAKFTDEYLKPGKYCFAVYSVNKDGYVNVKLKATVTADLNLPTLKVPEVTDVTIKDASSEWDRAWVLRAKVRASALDGAAGDVTVRVCGKKDELAWVTGSGGVKDVAWLFSYDGFAPGQSVCLEFWNAGYWGNAKLKSETVKVTVKLPAAPTLSAPDITDLAVKDLGYDGVSDWGIQAKVRATAINGSAAYVQVGLCGEDYQTQAYGDGSLQEVLRLYSYYGFVKGQSVCLEFKSESYWGGEALRSKPVQKTVTLP